MNRRPSFVEVVLAVQRRGILLRRTDAGGVEPEAGNPVDDALAPAIAEHASALAELLAERPSYFGEPGSLPLTGGQRSAVEMERGVGEPVVGAAFTVDGHVDVGALRAAVRDLQRRHDALRLTVDVASGRQRFQEIGDDRLAVIELDVRDADAFGVDDATADLVARPFDLSRGPLLRATLLRVRPDHHVFVLHAHRCAVDAPALEALVTEVGAAYAEALDGIERADRPSEPGSAFSATVKDRWAWAGSDDAADDEVWWRAALDRFVVQPLAGRTALDGGGFGAATRTLDAGRATRLHATAASLGIDTEVLVGAALAIVIGRWSRTEDVAFVLANERGGAPSGRIGCYLNPLLVRLLRAADGTCREVVSATAGALEVARRHGRLSFSTVSRAAGLAWGHPGFAELVHLAWNEPVELELRGLDTARRGTFAGPPCAELGVGVEHTPQGIEIRVVHDRWRFHDAAARRFVEHLDNVLRAFEGDLDLAVRDVQLLGPREHAVVTGTDDRRVLDPDQRVQPVEVLGEVWESGVGANGGAVGGVDVAWRSTGRLGRRRDDGSLEDVGAVGDEVEINGHRALLGDIESLIASCEGVEAARVEARVRTDGNAQVVARIETSDEHTVARVRRAAAQFLAVPLVPLVIDVLRGPAPPEATPTIGSDPTPIAPGVSGDLEARLLALTRDLLWLEDLGLDDDVFEHGADSLDACEIAAEAEDLGVFLEPADVYQFPTVRQLAAMVRGDPR